MRHSGRIIFAIGCIVTLTGTVPASSEPSVLVSEARKYMGTNPTARKRLWCATFMNMVLARTGYTGTNSDAAKSFAYYGRRISEPRVGAIAVLTRGKRGGHVGVVSGIDKNGNPIIISGNHNERVGEAVYSRARVIAYVMPTGNRAVTTQFAARGAPTTSSELALDSPIAELIAAIRAESERSSAPQVSAGRRVVRQAPRPAGSNHDLPLDPLIADLLSRLKDDPKPTAPPMRAAKPVRPLPPQREQRVQQTAGSF